tara:strand:+ start:1076 stop:1690 length:615 start_codon:yes stop_codon:yes gene_type:complete
MSWRFPKHKLSAGQTVTPENLNEGIRPAAEELSGQLNEHNWKAGTIPTRGDCDADSAFVWHQSATISDLSSWPFGNLYSIPCTSSWVEVLTDQITFSCPSTLLWVHLSAQTSSTAGLPLLTNYSVALLIDGQVVQETIIGAGDTGNDGAPGILRMSLPVVTSVVLPVASGTHTVSWAIRGKPGVYNASWIYVLARELIVLEMRR